MKSRITTILNDPLYKALPAAEQDFLKGIAEEYFLSFQDLRILVTIGVDLASWDESPISRIWETPPPAIKGKNRKQWSLKKISTTWEGLKTKSPVYTARNENLLNFSNVSVHTESQPEKKGENISDMGFVSESGLKMDIPEDDTTLMGRCPVASEKTRCCNLHTLDAVINCGYDCSYCTITPFYHGESIHFHKGLKEKLNKLVLDPHETYHVGTGQSSDSLMWGNKFGVLTELFNFARKNSNVILELKTKSANVSYLCENPPGRNVIATWSLNTPTIIKNEERGTASLPERIGAARKAADKGILVGFHFHPMVRYAGWQEDYREVFKLLLDTFSADEIVLISFGTLTYIKPVLKTIRSRGGKTKILQMPLEEIGGKYSYPYELKKELFQLAYESLTPWHEKIFFYLCMEDPDLWKPVFGYEYKDNEEFEKAMKHAYLNKIYNIYS
ncbi:MAG: DNA repair photolyase [Spirochaetales bacterium]|nr:DNA repair photolyase [Spirochaetales bacterium]